MARDDRMKGFHARRPHARGTRDVVIRFLAQSHTRTVIGRHRLAGWPITF